MRFSCSPRPLSYSSPSRSAAALLRAKAVADHRRGGQGCNQGSITAKDSLPGINVHGQEEKPIKYKLGGGLERSQMKKSHQTTRLDSCRVITPCRSQSVYPRGYSHLPFSSHTCLRWCSIKTKINITGETRGMKPIDSSIGSGHRQPAGLRAWGHPSLGDQRGGLVQYGKLYFQNLRFPRSYRKLRKKNPKDLKAADTRCAPRATGFTQVAQVQPHDS